MTTKVQYGRQVLEIIITNDIEKVPNRSLFVFIPKRKQNASVYTLSSRQLPSVDSCQIKQKGGLCR